MKKLLVVLALMALVVPSVGLAAEVRFGERTFINKGESISSDFYFGGGETYVSGDVKGDLVVGSGRIDVSGNVEGDVLIGGGTISIMGNVSDDVRVGGGEVKIGGNIKGDLLAGAGDVVILPEAVIEGDIIIGGGNVLLGGKVFGKAKIGAGSLTINNEVRGGVEANADKVVLGSGAIIGGDFKYSSPKQAEVAPEAKIAGQTNYKETNRDRGGKAIFGFWAIAQFFMLLILGLALVYGLKKLSGRIATSIKQAPVKNIGLGFVFLVVTPVLGILLMVSMIGIPLGILVFLKYIGILIVGYVFGSIVLGWWIERKLFKNDGAMLSWKTVLIGTLLFFVLTFIPVLGGLVKFVALLAAMGGMMRFGKNFLSDYEGWKTEEKSVVESAAV